MNIESCKLAFTSLVLVMAALSGTLVLNTAYAQVETEVNSQNRMPTSNQPKNVDGTGPGAAGTRFGNYDANGDGRLSQEEMKRDANMIDRAKSLDVNRDGYLSSEEYSAPGATSVTPPK